MSDQGIDFILKRRSIRKFTPQPVDSETIELLLKAAMAAPSAVNSQPWEFVVVTDGEVLEDLRKHMLFGRYTVPLVIAVCGSPKVANNPAGKMFWVQDCSAAAQNILLAAANLGLGAVWIGVYPLEANIRQVRKSLSIPEEVTPLCLIYIGYPIETKTPRTQYDEKRVHWQQYEPRKRRARVKISGHKE